MASVARMYRNLVTEAISARRSCPYPPLQVANGTRSMPGPQVDPQYADAAAEVEAAWLPVREGQATPMIGERVYDAEPGYDE